MEFEDDYIIIAIGSTGIKVTNRGGQWMRYKWHVRKGHLKIHIAVDVKSKKILSMMEVADEHVHVGKALPEMVENVIKPNNMTAAVGKLFADGAYDGNDVFRYLADNGILPCIKPRKNARVGLKTGHILRNLSVLAQRNGLQRWKDSVSYGNRWMMAETVFSSIKRMFD